MKRSAAVLFASVSIVVPAIAGCGGGDDGGDSGGGRLSDALSSVSAGAPADQAFLWTDVAAVRKAAGLPESIADFRPTKDQQRWLIPLGDGTGQLLQNGVPLAQQLKIDALAADQAVSIGEAPARAVRLDGVDAAAAHTALVDQAKMQPAKLGDRDILSSGAQNQIDLNNEATRTLVGIGNRVYAQDDTIALSGTDAGLAAVLGDGDAKLGDQDPYKAAADCLGDVVSAEIYPGKMAGADADLVAIGVRGGDSPTEVLCAVGDESRAKALTDSLKAKMTLDAVTMDTNQKLSTMVTKIDVDSGGSGDAQYARAVLTPVAGRPLGFLAQALQRRALTPYLGG
jgi:hypothetical protein